MNFWRISVEISVKLCFSVVGYGALESARTEHSRGGSLEETWRVSAASTSKVRMMECSVLSKTFSSILRMHSRFLQVAREVNRRAQIRHPAHRYPQGTEGKTAADVSVMTVTDQARLSGLKEAFVVLAANTAGRARATVREDTCTRDGAWASARLRGRFNKNTGATCFNEVFQCSWSVEGTTFFEDVWRDWAKKVSALSAGSLRAQALGQLTMSGLARNGQADLEDHLRLRAPC